MLVRFETPEKTILVEKFFDLDGVQLACSAEGVFYQLQRSIGPTLGYRLELADNDNKLENIADDRIVSITEYQAMALLWSPDAAVAQDDEEEAAEDAGQEAATGEEPAEAAETAEEQPPPPGKRSPQTS
jgi:hypothetical protein